MTHAPTFTLTCDEVPDPPKSSLWADLLRWMVCVMDPADKRIAFVAGCLSSAIQKDGLTEKQAAACAAILSTVCQAWSDGILVCQNTMPAPDDEQPPATATVRH